MASIRPRRPFRSPMMSPMNSSGVVTSTCMTGSSRTGAACLTPSRAAIAPAKLKASSDESTSWYEPS